MHTHEVLNVKMLAEDYDVEVKKAAGPMANVEKSSEHLSKSFEHLLSYSELLDEGSKLYLQFQLKQK